MKHLKTGRKFSRTKKQREALLKIMLGNLFLKRKIRTTLAKSKELKSIAEKMIGKMKDRSALKLLRSRLPRSVSSANIQDIASKTASRNSGFLRITRIGSRKSDGAEMAIIEIIEDIKTSGKSAGNASLPKADKPVASAN